MSSRTTADPAAADRPAPARGRPAAAVVALAAALGILTLTGSVPGTALALGGSAVSCGGIRVNPGSLPGRPITADERSGPAEGIAQLLRLSEWSRQSVYDGATWSAVTASTDAAILVATTPTQRHYIPLHRRPDGHWQIDTPCRLQPTR